MNSIFSIGRDEKGKVAIVQNISLARNAQPHDMVFQWIKIYIQEKEIPPSYKQVAKGLGWSENKIYRSIKTLVKQGRIAHRYNKSRVLVILKDHLYEPFNEND